MQNPESPICTSWLKDANITVSILNSNGQYRRVILILERCYCRVWPPDVITVMVIELNMLFLHCYVVTTFY